MSERQPFEVGDTCTLNSGSPILTVVATFESEHVGDLRIPVGSVQVTWIGNAGAERHVFPEVCLTPAPLEA